MSKILAVDDNNDILEVLQLILEEQGYSVDTLSDGNFLFDKIKESTPDLILLDIMLGNLDGRELCKDVKSKQETNKIPVILISASYQINNTLEKGHGAPDDFLAKPFDISTLLHKIQFHLKAA